MALLCHTGAWEKRARTTNTATPSDDASDSVVANPNEKELENDDDMVMLLRELFRLLDVNI
jgi:hypothetical protein